MGGGVSGGILGHGGAPTCTYTHVHARTRTHTCIELQMAASMEASMFSIFNMYVRACVHMHVYMHGTPPHTPIPTPTPIHPSATPQGGGPPESLKIQ